MNLPLLGKQLFVKRFKRWERKITVSKRQQFVLITLFVTMVLIGTQLVTKDIARYPLVVFLFIVTYVGAAFGLREDLAKIEWVTLLLPPAMYSAAVALFYFLLPVRWLTRIPVALLFAIGFYAFLLTQNIYNVAANRTIALLRAARSIGFLLTLATFYLLVLTILSFRGFPWGSTIMITIISWCMAFPSLWSIELTPNASPRVLALSTTIAVMIGEVTWILGFWPMPPAMIALLLSAVFYSTLGMGQEYVDNKLYKKTIIEFLLVSIVIFLFALLSSKWRGSM